MSQPQYILVTESRIRQIIIGLMLDTGLRLSGNAFTLNIDGRLRRRIISYLIDSGADIVLHPGDGYLVLGKEWLRVPLNDLLEFVGLRDWVIT